MMDSLEAQSSTVGIGESQGEEPTPEGSSSLLPNIPSTRAQTVDPINDSPPKGTRVWALPWIVMMVALYAFTLPWINFAIVQRYFLQNNWEAVLPGLGSTSYRKLTMRGHMANGAICLLLGPFQFIPQLRRSFPLIHRWSGRIYCTCAMLSCLFGLAFIALKKQLVGGWNMTAAFSSSGLTIGFLSLKAWQTARAARFGGDGADFTSHRNWGIRSYSQILAPMLYRYWYICLEIFHLYKVPVPLQLGEVCRSDGICPEYLRIFDSLHCWTYWITALGVAELIIYFLPNYKTVERESSGEATSVAMEVEFEDQTPLLSRPPDHTYHKDIIIASLTDEIDNIGGQPRPIRSSSPTAVNVIGWILAGITVGVTARLFTYSGDDYGNANRQ